MQIKPEKVSAAAIPALKFFPTFIPRFFNAGADSSKRATPAQWSAKMLYGQEFWVHFDFLGLWYVLKTRWATPSLIFT